jgi:hypothetical protein
MHQLRNGNRGTIARIDHITGLLDLELDSGAMVTVGADYLADGHLTHGYAMTIHKSQAMTTKRTFVLASPDLARELGYVAGSRHTEEARFYVNVGRDPDLERPQLPGLEDQPLYGELERALGQERAKHLAVDSTEIDVDLGSLSTARLLEITENGRSKLTSIPAQARRAKDAELLARAARNVEATDQRLARVREELAQLAPRHRRARADLEHRIWGLEASLESARDDLAKRTDAAAGFGLEAWLEDHEMELVEASAAETELAIRRAEAHRRATRTVALDVDPAIERILGRRPAAPSDRDHWERAAAAHESYRLQYGEFPVADDPGVLVGRQAADWSYARALVSSLGELGPDRTHDVGAERDLGR